MCGPEQHVLTNSVDFLGLQPIYPDRSLSHPVRCDAAGCWDSYVLAGELHRPILQPRSSPHVESGTDTTG